MAKTPDTVLGLVLVLLGALVLTGHLQVPLLVELAGWAAIVVGLLVLAGGLLPWGLALVLLGILLLVANPVGALLGAALRITVAVALAGLGILRLVRTWRTAPARPAPA